MEETEKLKQKLPNQEFDYFKIGKIVISRWYWIVLSVIVCMIAANIYLWYTPKIFATEGTIKLEEKKSDISDLVNVMGTEKGASKTQSEIFVLQSRNLILKAVKKLDYPVSMYSEGTVRTVELYGVKPLSINFIKFDTLSFYRQLITFKPVSQNTFNLTYLLGGQEVKKTYYYNSAINIEGTIFNIASFEGGYKKLLFKFNSVDELADRARGGLQISESIKNSGIIGLRQTDSHPKFAADFLNSLMTEYLNYDRENKQLSATRIIGYIDNQVDSIAPSVQGLAADIGDFKESSQIMDVNASAQLELSKAAEIETRRDALQMQLSSIKQFKEQVVAEKDNVSLNFSVEAGIDVAMNTLITNLNTLITDRASLLKTYISTSQPVTDINRRIAQVKNDILQNVNLAIINVQKKVETLNSQLAQANQKIATFPQAERKLVSLNRDFEIKQKAYTFLEEKKLNAQISRSAVLPGASIIEPAKINPYQVSPNESEIKQTGVVLGLLFGIGFIILIRVLNPFIYDKETVESLTTTPIIGVIRKFPQKLDENSSEILVLSQPKSVFAESVRSVRTNLSFLAAEKDQKVICVTSEVAGEGKSFVAVNLASTLSLIDKKIILIAADLRRSKLHKTFHVPNDIGLSNFLANQNTIEEIIIPTNQSNLDFIPSGPVPPNPSELLHTDRMTFLIDVLKRTYDIIMIDTAPVGLVSDSIPLIRASDINVFVIRSGKSKFYAATIPQRISHEYNLNNSVIVLNAFEEDLLHSRFYTTKFSGDNPGHYYSDYTGYQGSGYYIEDEKKKWWDVRTWFR
jgi:capsular exopolysaccharide synthesis family protein